VAKLPFLAILILTGLYAVASPAKTEDASGRLSYTVSYRGLLSLGMQMDIAGVELYLNPAEVDSKASDQPIEVNVSTSAYDLSEALIPTRFCYRSHLHGEELATREADWWSRIGSKATRGHLNFDRTNRRVLRLHAERRLEEGHDKEQAADQLSKRFRQSGSAIDSERNEAPYPSGVGPLDRIGMMLWLRQQRLAPGQVLQPAVSNGKQLVGYRLEVEEIEEIEWNGERRSSFRIRMEPRVNNDDDTDPTWLWLSRDEARLPLLLRSSRAFGSFEARLLPQIRAASSSCDIPETAGLSLPALN